MFKRVTIVALVVAAFLVLTVPAFAWNGMRADFTVSPYCSTCHKAGAPGSAPKVYGAWKESKHGEDEAFAEVANRAPSGSVCQGCHTSNFAPGKMTPTPTATTTAYATPFATPPVPTATAVSWGYTTDATGPQNTGNGAWSEGDIGCSSCHYGSSTGDTPIYGNDAHNTAHNAPFMEMANADICGACHSRYAYTTGTFKIAPIPYTKLDAAGDPIANPSPIGTIQPQMALGYNMLGTPAAGGWNPAAALSTALNIPHQGWTPTPTATRKGIGNLQTYWQVDGADSLWQQTGHDGSAAQYPEWANEGHANALTVLTSEPFWGFLPEAQKQECLECHSADFRIMKEAGKTVTSADVKYGVTCVGCHTPHEAGTVTGVWDEAFDAQLVGDTRSVCTDCHNATAEVPVGTEASPGTQIHHPMKEMIDGYGAIDVAAFPSVHKGKCIQCHMPPTSYSRGSVQMGGNHTFNIIMPEDAVDATPIPVATAVTTATTTPEPSRTLVTETTTVQQDGIPFSACSTCHNNNQKPTAVPVATVTTEATPEAAPTSIKLTVTANVANQGDKALWLQDTIDQRQEWTTAKVAEIHAELKAGAIRLGYADEAAAQTALVAIPAADRTFGQTNFLKAYTNVGFVESEGSFGLHNWDYSRAIVSTALAEAKAVVAVAPSPRAWVVTVKASKSSVKVRQKVKFRGLVLDGWGLAGKGTLTLQRKASGANSWKDWTTVKLTTGGTYGKTLKMTKKGTWFVRGFMPGDGGLNTEAYSVYVKVKVK